MNTCFFNGNPVFSIAKQALLEFIDFLKGITNPVLVGHYINSFDPMFMHHHLSRFDEWENFLSVVTGSVDTMFVFKKEFPKQDSYTQANLMNNLLHESYAAHNSLDDVIALAKLSELVKDKFPSYSFGANEIRNLVNAAQYKRTLKPLQVRKAVSDSMATKITKGFDGLYSILSEKVNGVPRVTKHVPVIQ